LGHPPFGHVGEHVLNRIFTESGGSFIHEINSYRMLEYLANKGKGCNCTYAVKDGIISHCGELFLQSIEPDHIVKDLDKVRDRAGLPATWEGCVVRISDSISYLGRDIEDALRIKVITPDHFDRELLQDLDMTRDTVSDEINSTLIERLIADCVAISRTTGKIGFSDSAFELITVLKEFNYKNIYYSQQLKEYAFYIERVLRTLYNFIRDLLDKHHFDTMPLHDHVAVHVRDFAHYLDSYNSFYQSTNASIDVIIGDYLSGMTDDYALDFCNSITLPGSRH
jgi:dGTPase